MFDNTSEGLKMLNKNQTSLKTSDHRNRHRLRPKKEEANGSNNITSLGWLLLISLIQFYTYSIHPSISVSAFNIDTQSAVIHQGDKGSYFGFSVAQHKDRGVSYLLVGAPKAQTDQPGTKQTGAVYKCTPINNRSCQQIPFDPTGSSTIKIKGETKQADDKSYQWFGASLHSANDNGSFVACAPQYVYFSASLKRRDPVGTCWVSRGSFIGFLEYSPCRDPSKFNTITID